MFRRCIIDSPSRSSISKLMSTNSTSLASLFHVSAVESTRARSPAKIRKSMNIKIRGRLSSCRHRFIKFNDFFLLPVQVGVSLSESPGLVAWPVRPSLLDGPSLVSFRVSPERDEGSNKSWLVMKSILNILMKGIYSCRSLVWEQPTDCPCFISDPSPSHSAFAFFVDSQKT